MTFSSPINQIIGIRQSKRDYLNEPLSKELIDKIQSILDSVQTGPFGNHIELQMIEKTKAKSEHKVKLGTYGFISGARYFIAGGVNLSNPYIFEDYGFVLENIILHLTDLGLGTCWLGGTFNRSDYSSILGNDQQLVVPAITPVGYPKQSKSMRENIIRWGAKSDSRKPWSELFYDEHFGNPLTETLAGEYHVPLEMLRMAPSASNKQPWRIVKKDNAFHFFLLETPGYNKMFKSINLQKIDMGIAMSHFEITCKEYNLKGKWQIKQPNIEINEAKYLVSWTPK